MLTRFILDGSLDHQKTVSGDYRDKLAAPLTTHQKRDIILNFLRAYYYSKKKKYFKEIPWKNFSGDDITGWPTEDGKCIPLYKLKDEKLIKIIKNLENINIQDSFFKNIIPAENVKKRRRVD